MEEIVPFVHIRLNWCIFVFVKTKYLYVAVKGVFMMSCKELDSVSGAAKQVTRCFVSFAFASGRKFVD